MKRRRHTPEQIVRKLQEADRLLAEQTYQRWRVQYKAMRPEDVARLKALEKENARLKRLLAEKKLDSDMLREVARGLPAAGVSYSSPAPLIAAPLSSAGA
jgi:putative transposase